MSVCLTHYPLRSAIKVEGESLDEGVKGNEMNGALTPASGGTPSIQPYRRLSSV